MTATICQLCKEPVWNFLCVECIGRNIKEWLPQWLVKDFQGFHVQFSNNFIHYATDWRTKCLHCKNNIQAPICPYCYTNEVFAWLNERDSKLAYEFAKIFNFDFEGSGYKEFDSLDRFTPVSREESEISDEGICEVCECYSEILVEREGEWICKSCSR